jgi:hypothetical protein
MKAQQASDSSHGQQQEHEREEQRNGPAAMLLRRYSMGMEDSQLFSFPFFANSLLQQPQVPIGRISTCGSDIAMQRQQQMQVVLDVIDSVLEILDEGNNTSMLLLDEEKHTADHHALE